MGSGTVGLPIARNGRDHLPRFAVVQVRIVWIRLVSVAQEDHMIPCNPHQIQRSQSLPLPLLPLAVVVAVGGEHHIHFAAVLGVFLDHTPQHIVVVVLMGSKQHHPLIAVKPGLGAVIRRIIHNTLADRVPAGQNHQHRDQNHSSNHQNHGIFPLPGPHRQQGQQEHGGKQRRKFGNGQGFLVQNQDGIQDEGPLPCQHQAGKQGSHFCLIPFHTVFSFHLLPFQLSVPTLTVPLSKRKL